MTDVNKLRARQMRNLMATLLLAQGTPMLLAGDEFARTQNGNNNAYCQDNEISWVDWSLQQENSSMLVQFTRRVAALRHRYPVLRAQLGICTPLPMTVGNVQELTWLCYRRQHISAAAVANEAAALLRHAAGWLQARAHRRLFKRGLP